MVVGAVLFCFFFTISVCREKKKKMSDSEKTVVVNPPEDASATFDFGSLTQTQQVLAAIIGVLFSTLLVYVFWRVVQVLLRYRALRKNLRKLSQDELIRIAGSEANANGIRSNVNDMWLNLALLGIGAAYGIGALVGFVGSLATLGTVVFGNSK